MHYRSFLHKARAVSCAALAFLAVNPTNAQPVMKKTSTSAQVLQDLAATLYYSLGKPQAITISPDDKTILFLRSGPRDRTLHLYEFTVATRETRELLTPNDILRGEAEALSVAEKARRERQRQILKGFTSYSLSEDGAQILVPLSGKLYVVRRADRHITALPGEGWIDSKFSPDGRSVAGVKDGELYVIDIAAGTLTQLTHGATETLTHGVAEFVAQEEMDRFDGFWWSPDSQTIAYEEANLSPVQTLYIPDPMHPEQEPNAFRYPRAGTPNAEVRLGIIPRIGGQTTWLTWDNVQYPYLARVNWQKSAPLTLVVQARPQTREQVLAADTATGATRVLLTETDTAWVNLERSTVIPKWREDGSGFFWSTERRGDWQLELRDANGLLVRALTPVGFHYDGLVDVDEATQTIVVSGGPDARDSQQYRVPMGGGKPVPITRGHGTHGMLFGKGHQVSVDQFSLSDGTSGTHVRDSESRILASLPSLAEQPPLLPRFELTAAKGHGRSYDAVIIRPRAFKAGRKYPVILDVYAGPGVKQVSAAARTYLEDQWMADQGYIVVSLDGRGTPGHGRAWERAIHKNLIDVALHDQVDGLQALGRQYPELDMKRVGITGWSFGGYFAAMATLRRPDIFCAGVSGAPVTDWQEYDTTYTERYMDLPSVNPKGYQKSSVMTYASQLKRPLLLIHGVTDDNVYFVNTLRLAEALFEAGKPFTLLPMTGTHLAGESDPLQQSRLLGRIMDFFGAHLQDKK